MNVVVVFSPVVSNKQRQLASLLDTGQTCSSPRTARGDLMDQCSTGTVPIRSSTEPRRSISRLGRKRHGAGDMPGMSYGPLGLVDFGRMCQAMTDPGRALAAAQVCAELRRRLIRPFSTFPPLNQ